MNLEGLGILGILFLIILSILGVIFDIVTTITITNFLQVTGFKWWIVAITLFASIGSPLVSFSRGRGD